MKLADDLCGWVFWMFPSPLRGTDGALKRVQRSIPVGRVGQPRARIAQAALERHPRLLRIAAAGILLIRHQF